MKEFSIKIKETENGWYYVMSGTVNGKQTDKSTSQMYSTYEKAATMSLLQIKKVDQVLERLKGD